MGRTLLPICSLLILLASPAGANAQSHAPARSSPLEDVIANDNRVAAGTRMDGILTVDIEARVGGWRPDENVDSALTVQAFGAAGGGVTSPGPLIRARAGEEVRVHIRNLIPDSVLVVRGLGRGADGADTVRVASGAVREVRFTREVPGTYLYWATTTGSTFATRQGRDSQLHGVIVVDPVGAEPDPDERIFVISLVDLVPDSLAGTHEDVWEPAVNGRSWPFTERLHYGVGDTIRWRFVNASARLHPMHLHGFHFRVLAKGDGATDTAYAPERVRHAVTELMERGTTFRMEWVPTRPGHWLMHCHMAEHISPFPQRPDSVIAHDRHDPERHPLDAMSGLVLGIIVSGESMHAESLDPDAVRRRLYVQEVASATGRRARGFILQDGEPPRSDSVRVPGSPLVVTRGQQVQVTVVNRLARATSVHWHGIEIDGVYDGVAGWSGSLERRAPLLASGDSFTVAFTAPRAGTYIYHTHMDEEDQLASGLYGALLVMEPGEAYDPETDLLFIVGRAFVDGRNVVAINGRGDPIDGLRLEAGVRYRLRVINILPTAPITIELGSDAGPVEWIPIAKDGADLPASLRVPRTSRIRMGVGETWDFEWTAPAQFDGVLVATLGAANPALPIVSVGQPITVR